MSDLFNQPCADVLVIGVGSLGCALASRGALNDACEPPRSAEWAAVHSHSSELFATGLERRLLLASPSDPFSSRSVLALQGEALRAWVKGKAAVFFAAEANDPFAAETIPVLLAEMAESGVSATVWLLTSNDEAVLWRKKLNARSFVALAPEISNLAASAAREVCAIYLLSILETAIAALHAHPAFRTEATMGFHEAGSDWTLFSGQCQGLLALSDQWMKLDGSGTEAISCILCAPGERTAGEVKQLEDTLKSVFLAADVTVSDVPGGAAGEPWLWLLFARKVNRGNIVALKSLRPVSSRVMTTV